MPRMKTLWVDVRLKSMIGEDATGFCWEGDHNREFYLEIKQSLNEEEWQKNQINGYGCVRMVNIVIILTALICVNLGK